MSVDAGSCSSRRWRGVPFSFVLLTAAAFLAISCGTGTTKKTPPAPPAPAQPNFPSIPPEPITWSPQTSPLPAPPAEDETSAPWKNGANDFPLSVSSPVASATVTSPVNVIANATPKNPIFFMRVYVDQLAVYFTFTNSINAQIFMAPGQHTVTVMAEDNQGYISATPIQVTVSGQAPSTNGQTVITGIQGLPGWQTCGALFPPGSGRDGQICAAGFGQAQYKITQNQSSPAMDGNSTEFSMGGPWAQCPAPPGYCNELNFNAVAGGNNVTHFLYDLYFYIDNPQAPQALEFDLNQTFGGQRWVWGSECNFNGSGKWDIWDDINGWTPTQFPCSRSDFPANTWIHLVWDVQRVGNTVQYNTLTVGNNVFNVNTTFSNEPNWTLEEIDVAFQMDGNSQMVPYNVWLDKVNLTAY